MQYLISFLEGIVTFVSPCLLPMLPIYISYFAGGRDEGGQRKTRVLRGALGFVLGFTLVFVTLGAFAGGIGMLLRQHQTAVNIVTGLIVIAFGLSFLGVWSPSFFKGVSWRNTRTTGFFSSVLFGMVFSVGWTPCVGAFLGSALLQASQQASASRGTLMLLCYSLGLAIPFLVSAMLIDRLGTAFTWMKKHYRVINIVSGCFLILMGILMMTGLMGYFLSLLTF